MLRKVYNSAVPQLKGKKVRDLCIGIELLAVELDGGEIGVAYLVSEGDEDENLTPLEMGLTVALAILIAVGLFIILPTWLGHMTGGVLNIWGQNLIEGVTRLGIFLIYLLGIRALQDIRRVFQYHGAEHKVINTYEDGAELTVEEVAQRSRLHPSCGTSFLLVVIIISIFIFAFLGNGSWLWKFGARLLLLPVIAGLGYEFIRFSRRHREKMKILIAPGLWVQKLTTGEPDSSQIEVAIAALKGVLPPPASDAVVS
jgi:uncharacterized protein YqhQ